MIQQKLGKVGNRFVVTIPKDEVERRGLHEGQLLAIEVEPVEVVPMMAPEVLKAFEES